MKRSVALVAMALSLAGCARNGDKAANPAPATLSDAEIIDTLNKRVSTEACCFQTNENKDGQGVFGPLKAPRELHFIVRRQLGQESIACGHSGFPVPKDIAVAPGTNLDTVFVVRGRRLYLREDMPGPEFDQVQERVCGPDWVQPNASTAIDTDS